ncbi:MAG: hypothetical protein K9L88_02390 [Chromatiaceae bacterium]|nr:hypothetical protein [Chromatiaceae bacterium]
MAGIIVFLNGARGLAVLKAIIEASHPVRAVVTPPTMQNAQVLNTLSEQNITHLALPDINSTEAIKQIRDHEPSLFLIAGFSTIFKQPLLEIPSIGTLNLHAGKLPQYRGGSPLNWQLINGELKAGISVIKVDTGIDTGPVMAEATIEIGPRTTIADLHEQANARFPSLVRIALERTYSGNAGRAQDNNQAQYWHQRNDSDGRLAFHQMSAFQVDRSIRALTHPYPGAWCTYHEQRVRLLAASIPDLVLRGAPGRICYIQGQGPYVLCADRAILLTEYKNEHNEDQRFRLRHGEYLR